MSRFDDCYDEDFPNQAALYHANTERALKGKRGQAFLKELEAALLMLPEKVLIEGSICREGAVCANGALALKRKVDAGMQIPEALKWLEENKPDDDFNGGDAGQTGDFMEKHFGILSRLAVHTAFVNDEHRQTDHSDHGRYEKVLSWVRSQILPVTT